MCAIAGVSVSGYYKWFKTKDEEEKDYQDYLLIKEIFDKYRGKIGSRRISLELKKYMNLKKIQRIMKKYDLRCRIRKANPYRILARKTKENLSIPNILNREFRVESPYTKITTDITYLPYKHGNVYLSVIKDICTREVLAFKVSSSLEHPLVLTTIDDLIAYGTLHEVTFSELLLHSDQGWYYDNATYRDKLKKYDIIQSMSRKGNCLDNAAMETFFGHLKDEVDFSVYDSIIDIRLRVEEYMEYYNNSRKQWTLQKMTPVQYRDHLLQAHLEN